MLARTIDNGSSVQELRAFGVPDVVDLAAGAGNVAAVYKVGRFREVIEAVTLQLVTDGTVANRVPRIVYAQLADDPFADVPAGVVQAASLTSVYSFVLGLGAAVGAAGGVIASPLPELLLSPGNTVTLAIGAGVAGDAVSKVRLRRQRYILVDEHERHRRHGGRELELGTV